MTSERLRRDDGRGQHVRRLGRNAQALENVEVLRDRQARLVRAEDDRHPFGAEGDDLLRRARNRLLATVDHAVQVAHETVEPHAGSTASGTIRNRSTSTSP